MRQRSNQIYTKQSRIIIGVAFILLLAGGVIAYKYRLFLRDQAEVLMKLTLPKAQTYKHMAAGQASSSSQSGIFTSTTEQLPLPASNLPKKIHLLVPFTSQAPKGNWDMPYQEACEEASMLMVSGYYKGDEGTYVSSTADTNILDLVSLEEKTFGYGPDLTATQVAEVMRTYDASLEAAVVELRDVNQIKRYLSEGIPVIVPADGKALKNPNFRNGGPVYHMLVITGYEGNNFITNDPGTRKGYDYIYDQELLMNAIHDWNDGDVPHGNPVLIIVRPKP